MANDLDQFASLGEVNTNAGKSDTDAAKAARKAALQAALQKTLNENGQEYLKIKGTNSANVQVVNVLGFGEDGGLIQVSKKGDKDGRKVAPSPKNVGYAVQNIGNAPIPYSTEEFVQDAEGKYVGTVVRKEIAPGEIINISRKYMTLLCADPTISNKLANGKLVKTSAGGKAVPGAVNIDAELESYTFVFNDKNISVNDESVKIQIGTPVEGPDGKKKYVVADKYVSTFGFLNNATEKVAKQSTGKQFDSQDVAANYIYRLAKESGLM
jgi:hypothetical protein